MGFAEDMVHVLQTGGVGVAGASLFISSQSVPPTGDGPYLTVILTGGVWPVRTHDRGAAIAYERPGAQLVVRCKQWAAAEAMARAAYVVLSGIVNVFIGPTRYLEVRLLQEPFDMGPDASGRARCGFNVQALKRP